VYFPNGKSTIDPRYKPQLLKLAEKALTANGYVIQVEGDASASGSAALKQKLSTEPANAVSKFLVQDVGSPLTNMLVPSAMGTTGQATPDQTAERQAANRRVIVQLLQNNGMPEKSGGVVFRQPANHRWIKSIRDRSEKRFSCRQSQQLHDVQAALGGDLPDGSNTQGLLPTWVIPHQWIESDWHQFSQASIMNTARIRSPRGAQLPSRSQWLGRLAAEG